MMSFLDHLSELATRLKISLIAFIIAFAAISTIPDPTHPFGGTHSLFGYNFLLIALIDRAANAYLPGYQLIVVSGTDPIFAFLDTSMVLALVISLPYIFHEIYGFIAPGLYAKERRAVRKYILPFAGLFATGGLFGLFVVFPIVMHIILVFFGAFGNIAQLFPLNSFVDFLLLVPFLTGLAFTFPVFIIPLVELRIIEVKQLTASRKWVYLLVALIVGLVDPDPTFISVIPIIIPIYILFEITVFLSKRIEKNRLAKAVA